MELQRKKRWNQNPMIVGIVCLIVGLMFGFYMGSFSGTQGQAAFGQVMQNAGAM